MEIREIQPYMKNRPAGAERLAAILMAAARDQQKTKGKTTMKALLKSEKELTVFTIPDERLRDFAKEAKRYGVLFCVVKEKRPRPDALSDIRVKAEDASKINRTSERSDEMDIFEEITYDKTAWAEQKKAWRDAVYVGTKKLVKRKEFEEHIRNHLII